MQVKVMTNILAKNEQIAARVQRELAARGIFAINVMGAPGSGKTSLIERTIVGLRGKLRLAVIEGDLFTARDAQRIQALGIPAVQINTGGGCHLAAAQIEQVLPQLPLADTDVLIIENVGNLVCPAEFDLGEDCKVTVYSITEGEDKPLKYPLMFKRSSAIVLNKMDMLPYLAFDLPAVLADIAALNPSAQVIKTSCRTDTGIEEWLDWIFRQVETIKKRG